MGGAQAESINEYRSYIQRRRVNESKPQAVPASDSSEKSFLQDESKNAVKAISRVSEVNMDNIDEFFAQYTEKDKSDSEGSYRNAVFGSISDSFGGAAETRNERVSPLKDLFKDEKFEGHRNRLFRDGGNRNLSEYINRKKYSLYAGREKATAVASYRYPARYSAEVEDNRATLLAIKIIKQCIACFAILGLVVLMQKINGFSGVLDFLRKYLVETHIEYKTVFDGVENIIRECSRFLGGTP